MDSRQSPFARNAQPASHPLTHSNSPSRSHSLSHSHAPSYGHPPSYPPASSAPPPQGQQHPYPPPQPQPSFSSDPGSRTFDGPPPFYPPSSVASRVYAPDQPALPPAPPLHPAAHGRHHSTSSIPPGQTPLSRSMPPPQSPTQQPGQQAAVAAASGPRNPFSLPAPLHAPGGPPSGGPARQPTGNYMGSRELPALGSRASVSGGSSMSISAMLGGRDSQASTAQGPPSHTGHPPPQSHYGPGSAPPATQGSSYATSAMQASPRLHHNNGPTGPQQQPQPQQPEYPPQYRRSNTPDPSRPYDPSRSTHASPRSNYAPDVPRYGTPQAYHPRSMPQNDARDASRASMSQPPTQAPPMPPARPSSNPKTFPMSRPGEEPRRVAEDPYARREEPGRPPMNMEYNPERVPLKPTGYDDRYRYERERLQPPPPPSQQDQGARHRATPTGRERTLSGGGDGRMSHGGPPPPPQPTNGPDYGPSRGIPPQYARAPESGHWQRQSYEPPRPQYEQPNHPRGPEYPPSSAPQYPPSHASSGYPTAHPPDRYAPPHSKPPVPALHGNYDRSPDRPRINVMHAQGPHNIPSQQMHQQPAPRPRHMEDGPPPPSIAYGTAHMSSAPKQAPTSNPSIPYDPSSSAPRPKVSDEAVPTAPPLQRSNSLLAIQEINRSKGRSSPLPQAVQGAQPQMPGPPAEHGIKSEFGKMYFGIGIESLNNVGLSSPGTSAATPFGGPGAARRDDDHSTELEPKAKGRKKKLRDEPAGEDDGSGRGVGGSKAKRVKTHQHQHHHHHHHHHHHFHGDGAPGPHPGGQPGVQGKTPAHSPTMKDLPAPGPFHHHHHARPGPNVLPGGSLGSATKLAPSPVVIPPQKKLSVSSQPVLDSVAHMPRYFLGDVLYDPIISTERLVPNHASNRGYKSTPNPLPWNMIKGKENCTLTVKIPKVHLMSGPREEITSRRAVWGTEVYTDDSDVVAACIHAGWIRGEWSEDVDVEMLELDQGIGSEDQTNDATGATAAGAAGATAESTTARRRKDKERLEHEREESCEADYLTKPPRTGPVPVKPNHDLQVTLLILPTLQRYASSTRFGIQSREFGRNHDGLSFMITAIRWVVNGGAPQSRLRGKARRERMRSALGFAAAPEHGGQGQGEKAEQNGMGPHSNNLAVIAA